MRLFTAKRKAQEEHRRVGNVSTQDNLFHIPHLTTPAYPDNGWFGTQFFNETLTIAINGLILDKVWCDPDQASPTSCGVSDPSDLKLDRGPLAPSLVLCPRCSLQPLRPSPK
ncbi:hypothetical protein ACFX2G_022649 [Malus domestica]